MLTKFEKFNRLLASWFEWVGCVAILFIVFITFFDVMGTKLFLSPILGTIDMVMLSQTVAIAFACAMTLILGRHIRVEFFVARLPERAQVIINTFIVFLQLVLFILIVWQLFVYGYSKQRMGEVSGAVYIPIYPFAYGIALASIPVCLVLLGEFLALLTRVIKK